MLEILPIEDKTLQETLCLRCEIDFDPDLLAYAAYINGKPAGICQFHVDSKIGILHDIASVHDIKNDQILLALGIATLNFIDVCGAHTVKCDSKSISSSLLIALGFSQKSDGIYENNIPDV